MSLAMRLYREAQCRYDRLSPNDFFPVGGNYPARPWLTETCRICPVWQACRIAGMGEPTGWWSGTTRKDRTHLTAAIAPGVAPDDLLQHSVDALRQTTMSDALATLKRRGWNVQHPSLHVYEYLPHLSRDGELIDFRCRASSPSPRRRTPAAPPPTPIPLTAQYVGSA